MPTYDYQCDACNHTFEEFQSMTAEPLKKCPKCKKNQLRRLFGAGAAILFKGSGFYQTDYRSEAYKTAAQAEQNAASSASSTASTNSKAETNGKVDASSNGKAGEGGKGAEKKAKSST
jgi:putative FmdB family regulatory protein